MLTMEKAITTNEAGDLLGITFRRIDYWIREGWITAERSAQGSGSRRSLTAEEVLRVRAMAIALDSLSKRTTVNHLIPICSLDYNGLQGDVVIKLSDRVELHVDLHLRQPEDQPLIEWLS